MRVKNTELQNRRMRQYFVDAGRDVIREDGISNFTIRAVARKAGYNSATSYNYFRDAKQLLAVSLLHCVRDYFNEYLKIISDTSVSRAAIWLRAWKCFVSRAFNDQEVYEYVFYSPESDNVLAELPFYYNIFPDDELQQNPLADRVMGTTVESRKKLVFQSIMDDSEVTPEQKQIITTFSYALEMGMGRQVIVAKKDPDAMAREFLQFILEFGLEHSNVKESHQEIWNQAFPDDPDNYDNK
ncbi:TetR/AcrR family transcriptional regulator [Lactobacillus corticis]|uniref:HTH tetR-type domain-containing protein n=1 Tax=Lactobacillus corticis TaxID=2201249 RepID=A0A916VHI2_9LACO|nr:TetR/AcrR family transcriptional regulator [Lactobacillus corticis]GFZ26338.1 hypothetical protein LCB40_02180 [Lactobacillus corticis]